MKILVGFEFSGQVRNALREIGHDAWSCDTEPSLDGSEYHIQADIRTIDLSSFQAAILFPPCTRLCRSGLQWIAKRNLYKEQEEAIEMFMWCTKLPMDIIVIENPVGIMSTHYRKPSQYIQPYEYGHPETKKTCLWLKGVKPLKPTNIVDGRKDRIHNHIGPKNRSKLRSITYPGIARAMAEQWF